MVELRSGRSARVPKPAAAKAAASAAIMVRCLHCRHEAILSAADLVTHGVTPDNPIAGFVRRLKCSQCGSGSVLAKRLAKPAPKPTRQRRSA
jgi:ribosomal protein S27E